jgi:fucose permease
VIQHEPSEKKAATPISQTLRLPAVWLLIALFFLTGGMEMTSGNWASSLYAERGVPLNQAAFWVAVYWATFTIGRIFYGIVKVDAYITAVLRGSMIAALVGAILLAWAPVMWVGLVGLGIIGFALAPLIPLLTSETPLRIGRRHAENSIGIQYSGAGLGIASLPALAGVWAAYSSLEVVPVVLIGIAVVMIVAHELLVRSAKQRALN